MDPITMISIAVIGGFFVCVGISLTNSSSHLKLIYKDFQRIEKTESQYTESIESKGDVKNTSYAEISYDRRLLELNRMSFNRVFAKYVSQSQMIALFPLLGILGTVLGLIMGGNVTNTNSSEIDNMLTGLGTALWTTFVGLIASIVLKLYDAKGPGQLVNMIDAKFNEVDGAINRLTLEKILSNNSKEERIN